MAASLSNQARRWQPAVVATILRMDCPTGNCCYVYGTCKLRVQIWVFLCCYFLGADAIILLQFGRRLRNGLVIRYWVQFDIRWKIGFKFYGKIRRKNRFQACGEFFQLLKFYIHHLKNIRHAIRPHFGISHFVSAHTDFLE